ncbi:MAG: MlaE family lipid ABC transporter permease subunit [Verrucomicrobiae bacterium]|nr:MlaE family lipid ABC transporter permease subunit [Verrucomicrobiae bacterium]
MKNPLPTAFVEYREEPGNRGVLVVGGRLDASGTTLLWNRTTALLAGKKNASLQVDASGILYCDAAGIAYLRYLSSGGMSPGLPVTLTGLDEKSRRLFDLLTDADLESLRPRALPPRSFPEEIGAGTVDALRGDRETVEFIGELAAALWHVILHPRLLRWKQILTVFEKAGVNALPIVALISFLVGLIIAFQSVPQLAKYGAQIYVINMVALVMIRELGPIMTAIALAGRSGSAFAAELGTMKINEELNALKTMGLNPVSFLVVERVIAGTLVTPLLTVYSMFLGILGGMIIMHTFDFSTTTLLAQLTEAVSINDVLIGVFKGFFFGLLVSGIGCLRGLQTQSGASAVGDSTTRAVVSSIIAIITWDAIFSVLLYILKI